MRLSQEQPHLGCKSFLLIVHLLIQVFIHSFLEWVWESYILGSASHTLYVGTALQQASSAQVRVEVQMSPELFCIFVCPFEKPITTRLWYTALPASVSRDPTAVGIGTAVALVDEG